MVLGLGLELVSKAVFWTFFEISLLKALEPHVGHTKFPGFYTLSKIIILSCGKGVSTVTIGWVGAPNERAPFRFHGAVVVFVDRCMSRTRNLASSN